ncbi:mannitol-1-phosphate 5-dehydrogenase [Streptococcaceae bacterium ESL0729]|nr:mannitol-1-phosphate 5-dehydrogenase [Streptococcaceae bacterium ESL0729]
MKKAVHFGAGNIGRGFIGEILHKNGFEIIFVDVNEKIINALNSRHEYEIELAEEGLSKIRVDHVSGINNGTHPIEVVNAIKEADIVTTAIGPNILPFIAELIAEGIKGRRAEFSQIPLDIIACENMIGGSEFLAEKVIPFLDEDDRTYAEEYIGFPNAAVDRIVPNQTHEDPLYVVVEPFSEWVIDKSQMKNPDLKIRGVHYAENLEPFIERKLFSVNTGHATVAYNGAYYNFKTIDEALEDERVLTALKGVQKETRALLRAKWDFDESGLEDYHDKIIARFANPHITDEITRVARTPIRKLGYNERFIRPIRELLERGLDYSNHLATVGKIFIYNDSEDSQSLELQEKLKSDNLSKVVKEVTGLEDNHLINQLVESVKKNKR